MPKSILSQDIEMPTRNTYTKVDVSFNVGVSGRELPNMAVLGGALEKAIELFQAEVKKSYEVVPPRVDTPISDSPQTPQTPRPTQPTEPTVEEPANGSQAPQPAQPAPVATPPQAPHPNRFLPVEPAHIADVAPQPAQPARVPFGNN